jgi:hypothetical protein
MDWKIFRTVIALVALLGGPLVVGAASPTAPDCCAIVEIRQYTLFPGQRDVLIDLFDRYFIDPQADAGMTIIGEFRVLDDPNRFFWIRGFPSMEARGTSLPAFYHGAVWKTHRSAANATMVDSDNVLLVRPASERSGLPTLREPGADAPEKQGLLVATIYHPEAPVTSDFITLFEHQIQPLVERAGAKVIGSYVTEASPNNFPALPVRPIQSFAWFACYSDEAAYERFQREVTHDPLWGAINQRFAELKNYAPPEVWRLAPTLRSRLWC